MKAKDLSLEQKQLMERLIAIGPDRPLPVQAIFGSGMASVSFPLYTQRLIYNGCWVLKYEVLPGHGASKVFYLERLGRRVLTEINQSH